MNGHSLLPQETLGLGWERVLLLTSPNQQPHTCRLGPGVCSLINFQPPPPLAASHDFTLGQPDRP